MTLDSTASEASTQPQVTPEMVTAYLEANTAYWERTDKLPTPPNAWRTGTAREATEEGLRAALRVAATQAQAPTKA